jgi:geranylgeranylglycerol-phosphate geranylgeranyltransferase
MKLMPVLRLVRIEHSLMLIVAVVAAELLAAAIPPVPVLILSIVTPIFVGASAFSINDYFDIDADKKNKKRRPLVSGELSRRDAIYITAAFIAIGVGAAVLINIYCAAIAAGFALLSVLYSYKLKTIPLVGNAYVALSMAIPFLFGSYAVASFPNLPIVGVFFLIFVAGLAREIDGTVRDYSGDISARKAKTLPVIMGKRPAASLALAFYVIAVAISMYMFAYTSPFRGNAAYLIPISIAGSMLIYSGAIFARMKKRFYSAARNMSLAGMAIALIFILVSALVYIRIPF